MSRHILPSCILFGLLLLPALSYSTSSYPLGVIEPSLTAMQRGNEKLVYEVSWSGGIKIGTIWMEVNQLDDEGSRFELRARVKDSGLFHFFYPVNDSFVTVIEGTKRLPISYKVIQKEGSSYTAERYTEYDQKTGTVSYRKNEQEPEVHTIKGTVHNEFSSFFVTRLLALDPDHPVIVPTFADGKRHEVVVQTARPVRLSNTIRGDVNVLPVTPLMKFKGLYDKDGDTVIWLTDDMCRIPVRLESKILIGSLTAELLSYSNPFCEDQSGYHNAVPESFTQQQKLELGD